MTIRLILFLTTWIAMLTAAIVFVFHGSAEYLWMPSIVTWSIFGIYCMYALTLALIPGHRNRNRWIGAATFSIVTLISVMLADALYQPTIGRVVSDILVFNIDRETVDEITRLKCDSLRDMADLVIASVLAIGGWLVGGFMTGRGRRNENRGQASN